MHFIKLLELYSMGVPLFLPRDFYMWAFSWTISNPDVMEDSPTEPSPASRRGRDKRGFHRRATVLPNELSRENVGKM